MAKRKRHGAVADVENHTENVLTEKTKKADKRKRGGAAVTESSKVVEKPKKRAAVEENLEEAVPKKKARIVKKKHMETAPKKKTKAAEDRHTEEAPSKKAKAVESPARNDKRSKAVEDKTTKAAPNTETKAVESPAKTKATSTTIHIVTGSYDHILHGMIARIAPDDSVDFADTFLYSSHSSAIRCVAVSPIAAPRPGCSQKVFLASGSTDERIKIYSLSAHEPQPMSEYDAAMGLIAARPIVENPSNCEVSTMLHHDGTITALHFPTRNKLITASEDSTVTIARPRSGVVLSKMRLPKAKAQHRPGGDTAAPGAAPTGASGFAVHPSLKIMITVSRGERCMRLWNLVTGKKAGVLSFGQDLLQEVGEGKHATGEARRVAWGSADGSDEFAVGFDREVVVFGMDSVPKCRALGSARTKVHQFCYVAFTDNVSLLAVSTEDGRIVFVSTRAEHLARASDTTKKNSKAGLSMARPVGHIGGKEAGVTGRIKDFAVVHGDGVIYVVGAGSEGTVRVWRVAVDEVVAAADEATGGEARLLGKLIGRYETQSRITCLAAYRMLPRLEGVEEEGDWSDKEPASGEESTDEDDDDDDNDDR